MPRRVRAPSSAPPWSARIVGYAEVPVQDLVDNASNWRLHPKTQTDALAGVLRDVGVVQNLLVNQRTHAQWPEAQRGQAVLIDGHARLALALEHHQPTLPVTYVDLTPGEEAEILATLDPLGAMAEANTDKLRALLDEVQSGESAVQQMLAALAEQYGVVPGQGTGGASGGTDPGPQIDRAAELQDKWGTAVGQCWSLGEHRVVCGDCTDKAVVERVLCGEAVYSVLTDPPYGIRLDTTYSFSKGNVAKGIRPTKGYKSVMGDEHEYDASWLFTVFGHADEIFLFGADYYVDTLPDFGKHGAWMVWDKKNEQLRNVLGLADFELIWPMKRHKRRVYSYLWNGALGTESEDTKSRVHPTQKPTRLLVAIIEEYLDALIIDPYLGSGSTLIACESLGRRCRGIELDPGYVAVTLQRWSTLTGQTPSLVQ